MLGRENAAVFSARQAAFVVVSLVARQAISRARPITNRAARRMDVSEDGGVRAAARVARGGDLAGGRVGTSGNVLGFDFFFRWLVLALICSVEVSV